MAASCSSYSIKTGELCKLNGIRYDKYGRKVCPCHLNNFITKKMATAARPKPKKKSKAQKLREKLAGRPEIIKDGLGCPYCGGMAHRVETGVCKCGLTYKPLPELNILDFATRPDPRWP